LLQWDDALSFEPVEAIWIFSGVPELLLLLQMLGTTLRFGELWRWFWLRHSRF
jgi:hypothetical protein